MKPVTVWRRWNPKSKEWEHNHIEDGHASTVTPTPRFPAQQTWNDSYWWRAHKWLTENGEVTA